MLCFQSLNQIKSIRNILHYFLVATPPITSSPRRRRKKQRNLTTEFDDITVIDILLVNCLVLLKNVPTLLVCFCCCCCWTVSTTVQEIKWNKKETGKEDKHAKIQFVWLRNYIKKSCWALSFLSTLVATLTNCLYNLVPKCFLSLAMATKVVKAWSGTLIVKFF